MHEQRSGLLNLRPLLLRQLLQHGIDHLLLLHYLRRKANFRGGVKAKGLPFFYKDKRLWEPQLRPKPFE